MISILYDIIKLPIYFGRSPLMVRLRKKQFNTSAYLDTCVRINSKINFLAGNNCALYHNTYIQNDNGKFLMGNRSHLGAYCYVNVFRGKCIIGDDVSIGPGTKVIVYSNHYQKGKKNTEIRICEDISIGNNVFIGANCVILPGTQIGDNVVVGAGSVVKGTLDENGVYAGSIVKKLKSL